MRSLFGSLSILWLQEYPIHRHDLERFLSGGRRNLEIAKWLLALAAALLAAVAVGLSFIAQLPFNIAAPLNSLGFEQGIEKRKKRQRTSQYILKNLRQIVLPDFEIICSLVVFVSLSMC